MYFSIIAGEIYPIVQKPEDDSGKEAADSSSQKNR